MTTATKTTPPSVEHRKLEQRREKAYAAVQEVKRRHAAHSEETEIMRSQLTERTTSHPEEFEGAAKAVRPNTEAAKLSAEIKVRMHEPNPHQEELDAKITAFHKADIDLSEWRERNVEARIAEFESDAEGAVEQIKAGFEQVLRGCEAYGVPREEVRGVAISTPRLSGQDVREDPRVNEWAQLAAAVRDDEITLPGLNDYAAWKVAEHA